MAGQSHMPSVRTPPPPQPVPGGAPDDLIGSFVVGSTEGRKKGERRGRVRRGTVRESKNKCQTP